MKAPVSWIREYVDLPGRPHHRAARRPADRARPQARGASSSPATTITGPLVVGRVLTMEPEPQKNGKTINWCTVDVGDANGTGEPQGIVCGAHNFAPGDLVVVVLPGGVLPGRLRDLRAQDLRPRLGRDDLLARASSGSATTTTASSCCRPTPASPATTRVDVLGLDEEVIEFEINPDRAYALSLRGVAREAALGVRRAVHATRPQRDVPAPNDDGYPVVVDDPDGCPVFVARTVTGFDPAAPHAGLDGRSGSQLAGMRPISLAVDVTNYVMLELGRPIHGYDADKLQGPIRVRRATEGERLTTLDGVDRTLSTEDLVVTDDSGIIGLGGVMGGETTEMSETTTRRPGRGRALGRGLDVPHRQAAQAHLRGRQAQRARRRPDDLARPRPTGWSSCSSTYGGGTAEPGVTVVGDAARAGRRSRSPRDLPARDHRASTIDAGHRGRRTSRRSAARSTRTATGSTATPPPWRPDLTDPYDLVEEVVRIVGYDRGAVGAAARAPPAAG